MLNSTLTVFLKFSKEQGHPFAIFLSYHFVTGFSRCKGLITGFSRCKGLITVFFILPFVILDLKRGIITSASFGDPYGSIGAVIPPVSGIFCLF